MPPYCTVRVNISWELCFGYVRVCAASCSIKCVCVFPSVGPRPKNWKVLVVESPRWASQLQKLEFVSLALLSVYQLCDLGQVTWLFQASVLLNLELGLIIVGSPRMGRWSHWLTAPRFCSVCFLLPVSWQSSTCVCVWMLEGASWYGAWSSGTTVNYQHGCIMHLLLGLETGNKIYSCGFWYTFYILTWKEVPLSVFLWGSEWLIKICGFLAGLKFIGTFR